MSSWSSFWGLQALKEVRSWLLQGAAVSTVRLLSSRRSDWGIKKLCCPLHHSVSSSRRRVHERYQHTLLWMNHENCCNYLWTRSSSCLQPCCFFLSAFIQRGGRGNINVARITNTQNKLFLIAYRERVGYSGGSAGLDGDGVCTVVTVWKGCSISVHKYVINKQLGGRRWCYAGC